MRSSEASTLSLAVLGYALLPRMVHNLAKRIALAAAAARRSFVRRSAAVAGRDRGLEARARSAAGRGGRNPPRELLRPTGLWELRQNEVQRLRQHHWFGALSGWPARPLEAAGPC